MYPNILQQNFNFNFLFSPNFHYFVNIEANKKKFIIKST